MDILSDDELKNLPNDPEEALLVFEELLWEKLKEDIEDSDDDAIQVYLRHIYIFVEVHELKIEFNFSSSAQEIIKVSEIRSHLEYNRIRQRLKKFKKPNPDDASEIILTDDYRSDIQDLLNKIRGIVRKADLTDEKRDELFTSVANLAEKVDQSKTRTEALLSLWFKLTNAVSEGAENLDPAIERLEKVMKIFGRAWGNQVTKLLPAPEQRKLPAPDIDEPQDEVTEEKSVEGSEENSE